MIANIPGLKWWLKSGLVFRLVFATGLALLLSGALMLFSSVESQAETERGRLLASSAEQMDFLLPLLAEQAVVGDYSAIQQLLDKQVMRSNLHEMRWTDSKGYALHTEDKAVTQLAPAWFATWLAIPDIEITRKVDAGGQGYGTLFLQATSVPGINLIWQGFAQQVSYLMLGLLAIFAIIASLVKWALAPLRTLESGAKKFGQGDYSVRIAEAGIPEMLSAIRAFNAMAENSAKLAASRIEHETLLRDSEEKLRQVTDSLGEGVYLVDQDWNISFFNPEAGRLLGWSEAEALGKNAHTLFHCHDDMAGTMCPIRRANLAGETYRSVGESFIRRDGSVFPISLVSVPIFREGAVSGSVVAFADITKRKEAEQALHESEERFRLIGTAANDGIIILGAEDRVVYWNPAAEALFGYSASEVQNQKMHDLIAPARYQEDFRRAFEHFLASGKGPLLGKTTQIEALHKTGQEIPVELSISAFQIKDQWHALGIVRDIAERKRLEKELQQLNQTLAQQVKEEVAKNMEQERLLIQQARLAAMGEMIGNIAHQWRQPINALTLVLANIKDAYEYQELDKEYLDTSVAKGQHMIQRMSATIDDFRNFFKPNKEKQAFRAEEGMKEAIKLVSESFKNNNIEIVVEKVGADSEVMGYPNEFAQVVLNALSNAKDVIVAKKVGGKVLIHIENVADNATLSIRDNGGGIPEEILGKVFDPYFTTKEKGTGIGLYMSKMIMDHMDGDITLRNIEGGAEVLLALPLVPARIKG